MVTRPEPAMDSRGEALLARVVAFAIDALVVGTLWALLWGGGVAIRASVDGSLALLDGGGSTVGVAVWAVTWLAVTGVAFLYFAWPLAVAGQSLGKRMSDLVVVTDGGDPCRWRAAGVRTGVLLAPAPLLALLTLALGALGAVVGGGLVVAWLVVELLVALLDDDHRRLGDRLAGTVVVRESLASV